MRLLMLNKFNSFKFFFSPTKMVSTIQMLQRFRSLKKIDPKRWLLMIN